MLVIGSRTYRNRTHNVSGSAACVRFLCFVMDTGKEQQEMVYDEMNIELIS